MMTKDYGKRIFFWALCVLTLLKLYYATVVPLGHDEAYHWEWARHLAFGYYDHPPMVGWLIAFFTHIFGNSPIWTRMTAIVCMFGFSYLTYRLGLEFGGDSVGVWAGLFSLAASALCIGSIIVTTDLPLLFFWQLTAFLVWRAVTSRKSFYWYFAGIALGFGLLSKFLMMPLILGVFLFLIFSREDRFWLRRKEPYLALGLAFLLFSPFIIWNSQHGWTTFVFQFTRHGQNINASRPVEFLLTQALLSLSPVLYGAAIWSLFKIIRRVLPRKVPGRIEERRIPAFALFCGWLMPIMFFFASVINPVDAHWPMAAYGVILAGLAWELKHRSTKTTLGHHPNRLHAGLLVSAIAWTGFLVAISLNQDWAKLVMAKNVNLGYGFDKLGARVVQIRRQMDRGSIIATPNYGFSASIAFYTPGNPYVSLLGPGSIYGRAYDLWDNWSGWVGRDVLFISETPLTGNPENDLILRSSCESYTLLPPLEIFRHQQVVWRYYFAIGHKLKNDQYDMVRRKYRWD